MAETKTQVHPAAGWFWHVLGLMFIAFKLLEITTVASWSWWLVLLPIYGWWIIFFIIFFLVGVGTVIKAASTKQKIRNYGKNFSK